MVDQNDDNKNEQDPNEQARLDQEALEKLLQEQEQAIQATREAMNTRIDASTASADVAGTDTVAYQIEPEGIDKVNPDTPDLQATQQKIQELSNTGAVEGHITSASNSAKKEEAQEEERKKAAQTATVVAAATYTAEQAVKMLDEIKEIQEQQAEQLAEIDIRDQQIGESVDTTISELDALIAQADRPPEQTKQDLLDEQSKDHLDIETIQKKMLIAGDPETQRAYSKALKDTATGLKNQHLSNLEGKQKLVEEREGQIQELKELEQSIKEKQASGEKVSQSELDRVQELKGDIKDTGAKIDQLDSQRDHIEDQVKFTKEINSDPNLTFAEKANYLKAMEQTSLKGAYSDATVQEAGFGPREENSEKGYELGGDLKKSLATLDPDDPRTEELYKIMKDNGFQYKPFNGDLLEGQAAIDALKADVAADRHDTVVNNINSTIDNTAKTAGTPLVMINPEQNMHRSELDAIYKNHKATPEMIAEIEAGLKEKGITVTEYEEGDRPFEAQSPEEVQANEDALAAKKAAAAEKIQSAEVLASTDTKTGGDDTSGEGDTGKTENNQEPDDLVAAAGTAGVVSGTTEVAPPPAPDQLDEKETDARDAVARQTEGGAITRDQLAEIQNETGISEGQMAKLEADVEGQNIKIDETGGDTMEREGIVAAADGITGGPENTAAIGAVITAAIPILGVSALQVSTINQTQTSDNKCNGINNGCFADSEDFAKYDNGPASYNNNGQPTQLEKADIPSDVSLAQRDAAHNADGDTDSSGSGGPEHDLEAELQLAAARDHQLQMEKLNEINRPDMTNDPKMVS